MTKKVIPLNLLLLGTTSALAAPERPNIIVILSDDMGYSDIGCYGGMIKTPVLDSLAATGLQYMQFYNTARSCPSRASLLTGLHPHQTGIGHMNSNRGADGYRGGLNNHNVTIGEVMQQAGYETYAVGKWHVAQQQEANSPKHNWPLQRGFDHYYGTIQGGGSFYDPSSLCRGNTFITPENDPEYRPESFYYTNALGDNACMFLQEHKESQNKKPFFMYLAFTAAHWPMQVPEADVEPYKGMFDEGWDVLRLRKYERMRREGLIDPDWKLSEDATVGAWKDEPHKKFETRCMEVYAGMVSNLDHNIGKVVEMLKKTGQYENTVIFYLQDNGGCAELMERQCPAFRVQVPPGKNMNPMGKDELQTQLIPFKTRDGRPVLRGRAMPGGPDTYVAYGRAWAWVSNTPFREYKHWVHEGGISTPLIVHWPAGITPSGDNKRQTPGQLMDIMATCVELSGGYYPLEFKGRTIYPCEGVSLVSSFAADPPKNNRWLFWEHEGNRAVRNGEWKLVYKAGTEVRDIPNSSWELYNMKLDRTETNNVAAENPKIVKRLAAKWNEFAERCHVKPWPQPLKP